MTLSSHHQIVARRSEIVVKSHRYAGKRAPAQSIGQRLPSKSFRAGCARRREGTIWVPSHIFYLRVLAFAGGASYLKETLSRTRYLVTLPFSMVMSCRTTSATRRSRRDFDAVSTALLAAASQDVLLVPTSSVTR